MSTNISGILNANTINSEDGKILSPSSAISTSFYEAIPLETETIYPYDATKFRLLTSGSIASQTQSIFWINSGTGGNGKMYLSDILNQDRTYVSANNITGFVNLTIISQSYTINNNITYADDTAYVYDITEFIYSGSRHSYNRVSFKDSDGKLYVYGKDLTSETNTASILLNVNGVGAYAIQIFGIEYESNTSSINVLSGKDIINLNVDGVTDYNLGAIAGTEFETGDYFIFTPKTNWSNTEPIGVLGIPKDPVISASYYATPQIIDYGTGSRILLSGNLTNIIKPYTEINLGVGKSLVFSVESSKENTQVITTSYPFSPYYLNYFNPFSASIGYDSYLFGYGLISKTNQVVVGTYNLTGSNSERFIIGNGNHPSNRSNLLVATDAAILITGSLSVSNNISANVITGTLQGTASWANTASQAINSNLATTASTVSVSSTNTNGTYYIHFGNLTSGNDNVEVDGNLTYNPLTNQLTTTGFTGSLFGTSSWSVSSSRAINAVTASYVNPLNQIVIITGSIILSSSAPPAVEGGMYFDGTDFYLGF